MTPGTMHLAGFVGGMAALLLVVAFPLFPRKANKEAIPVNCFCIVALLLVLIVFLGAGVAHVKWHAFQEPKWQKPVTTGAFAGLVMSAIFGMVGLGQVLGREAKPFRGKKRCILALLLVLVSCVGLGLRAYRTTTQAIIQKLPTVESTENRFRITLPSPWVEAPVKSMDPKAVVALIRSGVPAVSLSVVVTPPPEEQVNTLHKTTEEAKARLQKIATKVKVASEKPAKICDTDAVQILSTVEMHGKPFQYSQWIVVFRGYAYQINAWAYATVPSDELTKQAQVILNRLEFLNGPAAEKKGPEAKDYFSPTSGFSVKLAGTVWNEHVPDLFKTFPSAEWGVRCYNGRGFFGIIPLPLGELDPDIDVLSHVFLWRIGIESLRESVYDLKNVIHGPVNGVAFNFARSSSPSVSYRAEVLKGNGFAYVLMGCFDKDTDAETKLNEVFAKVEFDPAPEQPSRDSFTTTERQIRGIYLREMGNEYNKMGRYQLAHEYFKHAQATEPQKLDYIQGAVDSLLATGDLAAARDYLKTHLADSGDNGKLQVRLAWLQAQTGDTQGALESYHSAFAQSFRDDPSYAEYVRLLAKSGSADDAIGAAENYVKERDSLDVRLAEASVYRRLKKESAALEILRAQQALHPDEKQVATETIALYIATQQYDDALQQCNVLLKAGYSTGLVHYFKGRCEFELKHYTEAKLSLQAALRQSPNGNEATALLNQISQAESATK